MTEPQSKRSVFSGLGETFLAVVLGNLIYFCVSPFLPEREQHELFRIDYGLGLDFLFCVLALLMIRLVRRLTRKNS